MPLYWTEESEANPLAKVEKRPATLFVARDGAYDEYTYGRLSVLVLASDPDRYHVAIIDIPRSQMGSANRWYWEHVS